MNGIAEYGSLDGLALAELVRLRHVSALELVDEAIRRIEAEDGRINAVIHRTFDAARRGAAGPLPDGPFAGVPFLVKDILVNVEGLPTSAGNRLLRDIPMPRDSETVKRFRGAGVVVLGKTNVPEFGLVPYTEPAVFGSTRNPWDLSRTPGGSSGGSAAAVAARYVPMAHGSDGGGSIRIPASCCGVFGLKPSRGRVPTGPDIGEAWRGFVADHVLTRSVRDSAAMLDVLAGADVGAPYAAPAQERPFLSEVTAEPGTLRIAVTTEPFLGSSVHPDCRSALEDAARLLAGLGHEVVEAAPPIEKESFALAFLTVIAAETRADVEWASRMADRAPSRAGFEDATYALGLIGRALRASDYANALRTLQIAARAIGRFFTGFDVLLTPTLAAPPFPVGALQPTPSERVLMRAIGTLNAGWLLEALGVIRPLAAKTFDAIPYTPPFNVTGQPAMSVPLAWNGEGLPIGVHAVGRFGDEATLFRLAGQLERARPWRDRFPPRFTSPVARGGPRGSRAPDTEPAA